MKLLLKDLNVVVPGDLIIVKVADLLLDSVYPLFINQIIEILDQNVGLSFVHVFVGNTFDLNIPGLLWTYPDP